MKKLTIIIPVFNQEKLILRALDSIPIRDDIEIIVINDGSTDQTKEVIENYDFKNLTIIIDSPINEGCAASLNKGIELAHGEYILQLDSDDYLITNNFNLFLDEIKESHEDLIFFINEINNGELWVPGITEGLCDHVCLYKKDIIGDTRYPILRCTAGRTFHDNILEKEHSEFYTTKLIYHYNYPREGSNVDLYMKGLLKP